MPSPRDPDAVEPTLVPTPARPAARTSDTPHPAAHDATLANPATPAADTEGTVVSVALPRQDNTADDADITRMPAAGTPGTMADPEPDATMPSPAGRTAVSGAASAGISGGLSHDTGPLSGSVSGTVRPLGSPSAGGTMVGRFALKGLHASGGLGEVFTARDTELNREVAVKRIKSRYADDPGSRRRFLTEAELTARLDHPGVVPVFGLVNDARGRPVYAMRFIRGETLKDEIDRYHNQGQGDRKQETGKTEGAEAKSGDPGLAASPAGTSPSAVPRTVAFRHLLSRFVYVCQAIAYAHEKGIIHRDIKPANVMVGKFGEVLVVDWGLAKSLADGPDHDQLLKRAADAGFRHDPEATDLPSHMTMAGTAVGTPSYMPPEQAAGQLDKVGPRADVYSLGATLFAILTGKAPFTGKSAVETLDQVRKGAFEPPAAVNADCPKPLDAICRKAMALNPDDRYPTAQALAADVERWLSDEPVSAYQDPFLARAARSARRHPARVATAGSLLLAGLLAAGGIAWAVNEGRKNTKTALDLVTEKEKETAAANKALALQQQETATQRDRAVDQEKKTAYEKVLVGKALELARIRYEKAVETYGVLVHDIDKKLGDRVGMQAIRKTLLMNSTDGLRKLIEGKVEGNIGADRTLVAAHRQMGEVYQLVGETTMARDQFLKSEQVALAVRKGATPADARAADRDLARTLDGLAGIQAQAGDTKAALDAIDEAVKLFATLAADKVDVVAQGELAAARARRSKILLERGETGKAADECKLALAARQELAGAAPNDLQRRRDLAASLDALADVQLRTGDTNGAGKSATECLDIRRAVAAKLTDQPDVQRELAAAHARLGDVHFDRALMSAAAKEYEAGVKVLTELIKVDPQNAGARAELAALYGRLGQVQIRTGEIEESVANTKTGKALCLELEKTDPNSAKAQRDLALARERHGDALINGGYAKEGLAEYEAARGFLEKLRTLDAGSAAAKLELARGWERIGDAKIALKDPHAADAFAESVKLLQEAEAKDDGSASVKRDLAVALYKQADAYCAAGKPGRASELATAATRRLVGLAAANPGSGQAQRDIAVAYGKWGQVLAGDGHPTGALIVWQSSLDRFQKLADVDKANVQALEEEAAAWERLAGFYAALGSDQALVNANKAVAIWEALGRRADAKTKAGLRRLALARIRCGDICADIGDTRQLAAASDWYAKALKDVEAMKADPLLGPVGALAAEKLVFADAVRVGLGNPRNLSDRRYDAVRIAALRTIATRELRAERAANAASAADELAKVATTPEDLYAAARAFAGCAALGRDSDPTKDVYAKDAVAALKRAVGAGFRDDAAVAAPEWDAVRRRAGAELKPVAEELEKLRTAGK